MRERASREIQGGAEACVCTISLASYFASLAMHEFKLIVFKANREEKKAKFQSIFPLNRMQAASASKQNV